MNLTWTGSPFTLGAMSYASVGDTIWNDTNGDGVLNGSEAGIDNVALTLYRDNGDSVFDPSSDDSYADGHHR